MNKFRKIPDIGYRGWDVHVVTIIILQFVVIKIVLKGRNKNNYSETTVKTSEEALQEFPKPLLENIWMMEGMEWESSVELQKSIVKPESRLT